MRASLAGLPAEGFDAIVVLSTTEAVEATTLELGDP
jgi:hypothetical protein